MWKICIDNKVLDKIKTQDTPINLMENLFKKKYRSKHIEFYERALLETKQEYFKKIKEYESGSRILLSDCK